jgi:hypothetical protein
MSASIGKYRGAEDIQVSAGNALGITYSVTTTAFNLHAYAHVDPDKL